MLCYHPFQTYLLLVNSTSWILGLGQSLYAIKNEFKKKKSLKKIVFASLGEEFYRKTCIEK